MGAALRDVIFLSATLLAAVGCWEEVHYIPSKPSVAPAVVEESNSTTEVASAEPPLENNIADEVPVEPTTDELFGGEDSAVVPEESVAEITAPITEEVTEEIVESQPEPAVEETTADIFASDEESVSEESPAAEVDVMRPSRTALAAWRMSSRWSLAAAIYAKGQGEDRYGDLLKQANFAADLVNGKLPEFPKSDPSNLEATVIGFLLDAGTKQLADHLGEEFSPQYAALAELAAKTNVLLLVYTPKSQRLEPLIAEIRQAAVASGLPPELWSELVAMLERRELFAKVKQQVLAMHTAVGDYLAGEGE